MIDRVFDFAQVPCLAAIDGNDDGTEAPIRQRVLKISKSKAIIDTDVRFESGARLTIRLEFDGGAEIAIPSEVADCGSQGLFLKFRHAAEDGARRLVALLVQFESERRTPAEQAELERLSPTQPTPAESPTPGDDSCELSSAIMRRTRVVSAAHLAAKSSDVRVVGMTAIRQLIAEGVDEAMQASARAYDAEDRERLLGEAEASFQERLRALTAEKTSVEGRLRSLEGQLARASALLEEERARELDADRFTVSDAGLVQLEQRLERLLTRTARSTGLPAETVDEIREVIAGLLDDEREKIAEQARVAQSDHIALLEKKIGRLAGALDETTRERDRAKLRADALEAQGGGVAGSVLDIGLGEDDPARARKLDLLREVVQDNRDVRAHLARVGTDEEVESAVAPGVKKIEVKKFQAPPRASE